MDKNLAKTQSVGYSNLFQANKNLKEVKLFEGLYTQIAVSASGYIAIYDPQLVPHQEISSRP